MKTPRTLAQLKQDPRIEDWSDERTGGFCSDGLWFYLMPGWVTDDGMITIHEWTVADCREVIRFTRYCPESYFGTLCGHGEPRALLPAG